MKDAFSALMLGIAAAAMPFDALAQQATLPFEEWARPFVERNDVAVVPACAGEPRVVRRITSNESGYRLQGERDARRRGLALQVERYEVVGCQTGPRQYTVQTYVSLSPPRYFVIAGPVGDTAITPEVVVEYLPALRANVAAILSCQSPETLLILATRVVDGESTMTRPMTSWNEEWEVAACGHRVNWEILYDGNGIAASFITRAVQ